MLSRVEMVPHKDVALYLREQVNQQHHCPVTRYSYRSRVEERCLEVCHSRNEVQTSEISTTSHGLVHPPSV